MKISLNLIIECIFNIRDDKKKIEGVFHEIISGTFATKVCYWNSFLQYRSLPYKQFYYFLLCVFIEK